MWCMLEWDQHVTFAKIDGYHLRLAHLKHVLLWTFGASSLMIIVIHELTLVFSATIKMRSSLKQFDWANSADNQECDVIYQLHGQEIATNVLDYRNSTKLRPM